MYIKGSNFLTILFQLFKKLIICRFWPHFWSRLFMSIWLHNPFDCYLWSHFDFLSKSCPEVFLFFFIVPVLLPQLLVILFGRRIHLSINLALDLVVVHLPSNLKLLKIVVFLQKLVHLFLLLLVFNYCGRHFSLLGRLDSTGVVGHAERIFCVLWHIYLFLLVWIDKNLVNSFKL